MKVGYIKGMEQYIISSLGIDNNIQSKVYDDNFENILTVDKFVNCFYLWTFNIIFN